MLAVIKKGRTPRGKKKEGDCRKRVQPGKLLGKGEKNVQQGDLPGRDRVEKKTSKPGERRFRRKKEARSSRNRKE